MDTTLHPAMLVTNIKNMIPLILEDESSHFTTWTALFEVHCRAHQVYEHLLPRTPAPIPPASSSAEVTAKALADQAAADALWSRLDALVLQWIYGTISKPLLHIILDPGQTAYEAWLAIANHFTDHKSARQILLQQQFCNIHLESFPNMAAYCQHAKHLADQLNGVGAPVDNQRLVSQLLAGLTEAYESISMVLQHRDPLPDFSECRSCLTMAESTKKSVSARAAASSATALAATTVSHPPASTLENHDLENGNSSRLQECVKKRLNRLKEYKKPNQFLPSIVMVPATLRDLSKKSFVPREVSIGSLHYNNIDCEMEKEYCLFKLLKRIELPKEHILESCMQKVYNSMGDIHKCYGYAQMMTVDHKNIELAEKMVMDACFILEFCNKISENKYDESYRGNMVPDQNIIYDLVLLENQIPFFILDHVYQCTILKFKPNTTLLEFIHPLLNLLNVFQANINIDNISTSENDHILSVLYQCYKPQDDVKSTPVTSPIHSVVDLDKAGVSFKPAGNSKWLMGIDVKLNRFSCCWPWCCCKPTLSMPVLYVHDFTELVLRNLIAYEQQSKQPYKYITSYAYAMDMLVSTQEDVAKLIDSKVVVNSMGSNEEAAKMINSICKEVAWEHSFYGDHWKKLNNYRNSYWPKNIAKMMSTYFNSPWSMIALLAGIILFALTVVQTFFTIKSVGNK